MRISWRKLFLLIPASIGLAILAGVAYSPFLIVPALLVLGGTLLLAVGASVYVIVKSIQRTQATSRLTQAIPASTRQALQESRYQARRILRTVDQYPAGSIRDRLENSLDPVHKWLANLDRLETGLAKIYSQYNLTAELRTVKMELEQLRRRMLTAHESELEYLRRLKESKEQHLLALRELQLFQSNSELKIRKIAADLGTTHAEMVRIIARGDFNEARISRLDESLQEHLDSVRDMLSAMDDMSQVTAGS